MAGEPTKTTTIRGQTLAFNEYGDPEGEPVVFLHGTPGSRLLSGLFNDTARRVGCRIIAPDRPGFGRSTSWPVRKLTDAGIIVANILDACGVADARLVGFSGGGPHALAAAATRSNRVREVHLVSGATPPEMGEPVAKQQRLATLARRTPRLLGGLFRTQAWLANWWPNIVVSQFTIDPQGISDTDIHLVTSDFIEAVKGGGSGAVTESRLLATPWTFDLTDVDVATQLWHGTRDENVPVDGIRELCESLPDADLTVHDTDHLSTLLAYRESFAECGTRDRT
ncbi:alpha/beta hydrolase [Halorubrum sp. AD140]|uniref:alpha/beta fold hydrolase n=1 Tax=Halorubrum sp. AD140 TaxID=3050073 RepID=UPI002ACCB2BF|nr:alpha/beta hydrolase [Halorubrum sp. AD140]MDZ5810780.1 alpha/beta hydrolase [Halorubrum sp. AD140]